jgi:hypothetical protein
MAAVVLAVAPSIATHAVFAAGTHGRFVNTANVHQHALRLHPRGLNVKPFLKNQGFYLHCRKGLVEGIKAFVPPKGVGRGYLSGIPSPPILLADTAYRLPVVGCAGSKPDLTC